MNINRFVHPYANNESCNFRTWSLRKTDHRLICVILENLTVVFFYEYGIILIKKKVDKYKVPQKK